MSKYRKSAIMAHIKTIVVIFALYAFAAVAYGQIVQGGLHVNQDTTPREATEDIPDDEPQSDQTTKESEESSMPVWVPCDVTTTPRLTCSDCNTRLICMPFGAGILRVCDIPFRPHCNNGIYSPVPSLECS